MTLKSHNSREYHSLRNDATRLLGGLNEMMHMKYLTVVTGTWKLYPNSSLSRFLVVLQGHLAMRNSNPATALIVMIRISTTNTH